MLFTALRLFHLGRRFAEDRHFGNYLLQKRLSLVREFSGTRGSAMEIHPRSVGQQRQ
jgi:hypothetical protein